MQVVWYAVSFVVGSLLTTIPMLAAFSSRVAVLEKRADTAERDTGRLLEQLEQIRKDINGLGAIVRQIPAFTRDD